MTDIRDPEVRSKGDLQELSKGTNRAKPIAHDTDLPIISMEFKVILNLRISDS